jgi:hypothetical protein
LLIASGGLSFIATRYRLLITCTIAWTESADRHGAASPSWSRARASGPAWSWSGRWPTPGRPWDIRRQADQLEDENVQARLAALETRSAQARITVSEPLTHRKAGPHSFFLDVARERRRPTAEVMQRLARHAREMDVELPKRQQMWAR